MAVLNQGPRSRSCAEGSGDGVPLGGGDGEVQLVGDACRTGGTWQGCHNSTSIGQVGVDDSGGGDAKGSEGVGRDIVGGLADNSRDCRCCHVLVDRSPGSSDRGIDPHLQHK